MIEWGFVFFLWSVMLSLVVALIPIGLMIGFGFWIYEIVKP